MKMHMDVQKNTTWGVWWQEGIFDMELAKIPLFSITEFTSGYNTNLFQDWSTESAFTSVGVLGTGFISCIGLSIHCQ